MFHGGFSLWVLVRNIKKEEVFAWKKWEMISKERWWKIYKERAES